MFKPANIGNIADNRNLTTLRFLKNRSENLAGKWIAEVKGSGVFWDIKTCRVLTDKLHGTFQSAGLFDVVIASLDQIGIEVNANHAIEGHLSRKNCHAAEPGPIVDECALGLDVAADDAPVAIGSGAIAPEIRSACVMNLMPFRC